MKNLYLLLVAVFASITLFAQTIQRNVVILEISTSTLCTFCPGAANAAEQLISEGKAIAVIENHNNGQGPDPYTNIYSNARCSYYAISGNPTGIFDGTNEWGSGAGCPNGNVYSDYLPIYQSAIAVPSPVSICLSGTKTGNDYTVNVSVTKLASVSGSDLRLHLFLTESHIVQSWEGCMTELNFVNRLMVPGVDGTSFSFASGDVKNFTLNFTKDASWNAANCELIAFVQDYSTKTTYNGIKCSLNSLPSTLMTFTDFSGTPATGCAPISSSFSATTTGVGTYSWTFPGGSPSASSSSNPFVSYANAGRNDVSLEISNGVCKETHTKAQYIVVYSPPTDPGIPQGSNGICVNAGTLTYSVPTDQNVATYTWDLTPSSAGTLNPSGSSCQVTFASSYTGTATLKVKAGNLCSESNWSPGLNITVSEPPAQPSTPTGPTTLCLNPQSSEYTTTAVPNATNYIWSLNPSYAGTVSNNGTSASVTWASGWSSTASLKVAAITSSCQGLWSGSLIISVSPPQQFSVTGGGAYCGQGGTGSPIELSGSLSGTNYTLYMNSSATSITVAGTGSAISFGNQLTAGLYSVMATRTTDNCTAPMIGGVNVTIDPELPHTPGDPNGPAQVNSLTSATTDYNTNGGVYATTYTWQLSPADAGTVSGYNVIGTATWNPSWTGAALISVQGVNTCGGGTFSNEYQVLVEHYDVGISEKNQARLASIYPNPAKGQVNIIPLHAMKASLKISNSLGSVVLSKDETDLGREFKLDISGLTPGLYFISIYEKDNTQITKLIVE